MRRQHLILLCAGAIACGATAVQPTTAPKFDGARAFAHVREQVAIGPRPAGSAGAERTRAYITAHLKSLGITTEEQRFEASTPARSAWSTCARRCRGSRERPARA
jgi:hypothetical protein